MKAKPYTISTLPKACSVKGSLTVNVEIRVAETGPGYAVLEFNGRHQHLSLGDVLNITAKVDVDN